jgi:hypothetical protein
MRAGGHTPDNGLSSIPDTQQTGNDILVSLCFADYLCCVVSFFYLGDKVSLKLKTVIIGTDKRPTT